LKFSINFLHRFYICCDKCQDWFHGKCVGILQSEAEDIDEYICPNCQKNNSVNFANMKTLNESDYGELLEFLKEIQVSFEELNVKNIV
jgi:nucleosome-remodeling factor subunit BPTF